MNDSNLNDVTVPQSQLSDSLATIRASLTLHAGPLPPPETVERYELVLPGAFDRILTMAETDQRDKNEYNGRFMTVYEHDSRTDRIVAHCGQIFGFATVVIYFSILAVTVWFDNTALFTALFCAGAFAGLARLVRSFQKRNSGTSANIERQQNN